jgi:hypothetical protein
LPPPAGANRSSALGSRRRRSNERSSRWPTGPGGQTPAAKAECCGRSAKSRARPEAGRGGTRRKRGRMVTVDRREAMSPSQRPS